MREMLLAERAYIDAMLEHLDAGGAAHELEPPLWLPSRLDAYRLWRAIDELREDVRRFSGTARCAFGGQDAQRAIELLVTPGRRAEGLSEIREFTRGARSLIVVDPYIYGGEGLGAEEYVESLAKSLRLQSESLTQLHVVYSSAHGNTKKIRTAFKCVLGKAGVQATHTDSPVVHDRIWVRDRSAAIVVGNSYGGLGRERASFVLPLPDADLARFMEYLGEAGLLSGERVT